jgi:cytochrome c553
MRREVAAPYATRRPEELASALERAARLNPEPERWTRWTRIAEEGAAAARGMRWAAALAACGRCHAAYRTRYIAGYRERALSER